jgi:TIR domain-containing protein
MPLSLKAFLSHRYKSPAVNTYFYELFAEAAELQFDVDHGTGSTNVTRLERMIRDTDAFVGIYPFEPEEPQPAAPIRQQLLDASTYFRLELALAARAKAVSIVFVDQRFGQILAPPAPMLSCTFDHREVTGRGGSPNRNKFQQLFARFIDDLTASMRYEQTRPQPEPSRVAFLLPPDAYDQPITDRLEALTADANIAVERVAWPPKLDDRLAARLQLVDWVVTDVGPTSAASGLAGYLHGQFVPTLRLARQTGADAATWTKSLQTSLYGGHEVGYPKDIVSWTTVEELLPAFSKRLDRILQDSRRIGTIADARDYFLEAARRKEAVFVSYTGADQDRVAPITAVLRKRFQSVFDYRDGGQSIEPGQPWMEQIFTKLDRSAVGILMLSPGYLASGNCAHEARNLVAARDSSKITLFPIKLGREDIDPPSWLGDVQYLRAWEYPNPDAIVDRIVQLLK